MFIPDSIEIDTRMRLTYTIFTLAAILPLFHCAGATSEKYSGLVSPSYEVRDQTKRQLLRSDRDQLFAEVRQLILARESKPDVAEAALLLLRDKSDSLPQRLLSIASNVPSARARATLLGMVELDGGNAGDIRSVEPLLRDTNLIVRLEAAWLLENRKAFSDAVMTIAFQALSSDETEWLGDPPRPAAIIAKQLLTSIKDKKKVLAFLKRQSSEEKRVKYHLLDLEAYLSKRNERLIYNHVGDPTDREVEFLEGTLVVQKPNG